MPCYVAHVATSPFNGDVPARHFLREWREFKGLSQEELGRMVGATGGMISRYEKGDRGLPLDFMLRLFDALDILPGQFFSPPQAPTLDVFALSLGARERKSLIEVVKIVAELSEQNRQELLQQARRMKTELSPQSPQSTPSETV